MKKTNKQNIETIVLENSKTGETLELQHEQHKAEYGAKHFWKADKKFFELLSAFSAAESKVLAYILQKTQPTKNEFIGACKTIARKLNCDVTTVRSTFKKMAEKDMLAKTDNERIWMRVIADRAGKRTVIALVGFKPLSADGLADRVAVLAKKVAELPERGIFRLQCAVCVAVFRP